MQEHDETIKQQKQINTPTHPTDKASVQEDLGKQQVIADQKKSSWRILSF